MSCLTTVQTIRLGPRLRSGIEGMGRTTALLFSTLLDEKHVPRFKGPCAPTDIACVSIHLEGLFSGSCVGKERRMWILMPVCLHRHAA